MALIIVIGIIVDDAIIVSENIVRYAEKGLPPLEAASRGVSDVFKPVLTTILTTFLAFSPMFFMPGIMGKFIYVIPVVITIALSISLVEVCIALPAHIQSSLKKISESQSEQSIQQRIMRPLRDHYQKYLYIMLKKPLRSLYIFIGLFFTSLVIAFFFIGFELFPESAADQCYIQVELPSKTTLLDTEKSIKPIEDILIDYMKENNEILGFSAHIGLIGDNFRIREKANHALIYIDMPPISKRRKTAREVVNILRPKTAALKGFERIQYRVDGGGPPVGKPLVVRIISENDVQRNRLSNLIYKDMESREGVMDLERSDKADTEQLYFKLNFDKMARYGIFVNDITQTIRTAYTGTVATSVRYGDEDVNFRVILSDQYRNNKQTLKSLLIPNRLNRLIPLQQLATIQKNPAEPNYYHYDGLRSTTITGDVDKDKVNLLKLVNSIEKKYQNDPRFADVSLKFGGESQETKKSVQDLLKTFLVAIIGIFFLLILLFNSILQPFLVISAIPFGIMGVIVAFFLHGTNLSFIAIIGTVGLCGVVVNDSLVMVNHINVLRKQKGDHTSIIDIIVEGSTDRLRPIVLTSLTTIAGVVPLAYGIGGSDPFIASMALALGYGLLFSTPLILFFLPCFYLLSVNIRTRLNLFPMFQTTAHPAPINTEKDLDTRPYIEESTPSSPKSASLSPPENPPHFHS